LFASFRKKIKAGIELQAGKLKAQQTLADAGMSQAWDVYTAALPTERDEPFEETTIRDMVSKLVRYGSLSEKQNDFMGRLILKINDRARVAAEREERDANRKPVPVTDKRLTIVGTILSAKYEDGGYFGGFYRPACVKVTVEHADGWRVFGNLPSELWSDAVTYGEASWHNGACTNDGRDIDSKKLKGRKVQFDARINPSDRDNKFGFFKRPTKASFIVDAEAVAA
jgi:hypothetical protein